MFFVAAAAGTLGLIACSDDALAGDEAGIDGLETDVPETDALETDVLETDVPETDVVDATDLDTPAPRFDPAVHSEAARSTFPIGVGSSDPTSTSIMLTTLYAGSDTASSLELVVWQPDDDLRGAGTLSSRQPIALGDGGFITFDFGGLASATRYAYAFIVGATLRSPIGTFQTTPPDDASPVVVLGATSCAKWDLRPFHVVARAAEDSLAAFLLLGDTTYADDATTLPQYRENWARNLGSDEFRSLRGAVATVATWDDHEVENNWDPESFDAARLAAARQAFFEHLGPRRSPDDPARIWRSLRWGTTVELFVLDCRSERRPSTAESASAQFISETQLSWFADTLAASRATFKLVMTSLPITAWPTILPGRAQRWQGYDAQRERILALTRAVPGVLWLAGDLHFAAVTRVGPPNTAHATQREVLVGPVAHLNPAFALVQLGGTEEQFPFLSGERNYGRLTFDPKTSPPRVLVEHIDGAGAILNSVALMLP